VSITTSEGGDVSIYTFSVSGVTNGDCSACDSWNGDWELCWRGDDEWDSGVDTGTDCEKLAGEPFYKLVIAGGITN